MAEQTTTTTETTTENVQTETKPTEATATTETDETASATLLAKDKEIAKLKAALDKSNKEAGDARKALRAKQTAEEAAAEEKREADEERDRKLAEYEKKFSVLENTAKVLPLVNNDQTVAAQIAEYLYGAADPDAVLDLLGKEWSKKEKALRLEFGKIPAPGAGTTDGPTLSKKDIMSIKDPEERQKAIRENYQLFAKG